MKHLCKFAAVCLMALSVHAAPVVLEAQEADDTTATYTLIESVLGSGTADEVPDPIHPEFGSHITRTWDDALGKYVFNFFLHVTPDNDRTDGDLVPATDRQRNEIKTMTGSPAYVVATNRQTSAYRWWFKIDSGFQPSPSFSHIHQIKAVNDIANDSTPLITITPRAGSPEKMQIMFAPSDAAGQSEVASANLSGFKGEWIEANEKILNATNGTYEIVLKRVRDGSILLSYTNNNIIMWRGGNSASINRPKWGLYRSLTDVSYLRDEMVQFADFSIAKNSDTFSNIAPSITIAPTNLTVIENQDAVFSAEASGTPALKYRWKFNTTNNLSWATNATMTITNVRSSNAGSYSVVVSNSYGTATSAVATLTVQAATAPSITEQPQNVDAVSGMSLNFSVTVSGSTPLTYQWRKDGSPIGGATNNPLSFINVDPVSAGNYDVIVANIAGAVTSSVAILAVTAESNNVFSAAGVTNWICPADVTSVRVECWGGGGAGGSAKRTSTTTQYGGGGAGGAYAKYTSYPVTPGSNYYINVGSGAANSSTNDNTTVAGGDSWFNTNNSPSSLIIAKGGAGGESAIGSNTVTRYGAGGTGTTNGSAGNIVYAGGSGYTAASSRAGGGGSSAGTSTNGKSATSNTGATAPTGGGNGGSAPTSQAKGGNGSAPGGGGAGALSSSTTLYAGGTGSVGKVVLTFAVAAPPVITNQPASQSTNVGGTATFRVGISGAVPLTYRWWFNGSDLGAAATNSTLVITNVQLSHAGNYTVVITNTYGVATSTVATLTVFGGNSTNIYTTTGVTNWVCPAGVNFVQVQCWGAGGAGGSASRNPGSGSSQYGGGGAGGAYAKVSSYSVTPGNTYYINVGAGGANSSAVNDTTVAGGDSWFNSANAPSAVIIAKGGAGGQSAIGNTSTTAYGTGGTGTTAGSAGEVVYAGGSGGTQTASANGYGGSGGGSGGTGSAGNNGNATGTCAIAVTGGGPGGNPNPVMGSSGVGQAPTTPPGGGGGGARDASTTTIYVRNGGSGASGQVILTYAISSSGGVSGVSATAAAPVGNRSGTGGLMVPEGRDITLTETPSAGTAPFTYAWKKVGSGTVLGTNSTLLISSPTNGAQYICDVAATWDGVTSTSPAATITALPFLTVMGSSVALGVGSTPSTTLTNGSRINGYAGLLTALLTPQGWMVTNISIGGQDTIDALARFTPDLVPRVPNYVLLGYSLANEGLPGSTNPVAVASQFTNNMTTLIGQCRSNGISPVIALCYPEADYTLSEYGYIKSVNQTINNWNVPSINLLGALDDGNGQWIDGYGYDVKHPNNAGHQEFFYSIVPTLFDALHAGKTNSPRLAVATQFARLTRDGAVSAPITFTPSNTMHSFTVSFRVRSANSGTIAAIRTGASYATLEIRADKIVYVSTNGQEILSSVNATNGDWHDVALTYRYAQTNTSLIVNGALAGTLTEQYVPDQFTLGGPAGASGRPASPLAADYQNWCVYRSAWNIDEAQAQLQGRRQQASMEICATLDDTSFASGTSASNQAQSLSLAVVNTANFTPMVQSVSSPSGLSAQSGTGLVVNLTWTRNSTTESGFVVERRLTGTTAWSDLVVLPAGSVSYTDSDILTGGSYDYRVSALEGGLRGNYSNTASISFADILTVSLTAPTNGASFMASASITLTANASSLTGTITTVDFYAGTTLLGSDTTLPYAYTWTNVATGSYNLMARAADNSGAVRTSAVAVVTVVDPTYTLTVTSGTGSGSYTNGAQVPISANAISGKIFVQWAGNIAYVNNVTYTNALVTMPTNAVSLTATYTNSASLLSVDFESDTVSNSPTVLGAIVRPSPSTVSNYVTVVDSSGNKAGTGQGVRFFDNTTNAGTAVEYNFVADAASQISLVQASLDFSCLASSAGSGYISVGLGAYSTSYSMSAASARWNEFRLYQDNTLKPTLNGSTTGQSTFSLNPVGTANTLVMFANDSTAPIDYNFNGAQTLAADTVVYWLNGTKIATLVLDNEVTNSVNNFGKIGFCAGTTAVGIDYALDNIVVMQISAAPTSSVSATAAMPTGSGTGTGGLTVGEGSSITLTETPSAGTAPFTYAWKKVGSGTVLGTSSNLLISSPTNGAQYTCSVAATWDGVTNTSPVATLTVLPLVSATAAKPTGNGSGTSGLTAYAQRTRMTLTETPSGGTPPFSYAWKKVGSGAVLGTNSTLTISPLINGDQYVCDVASSLDGVTNTSPAATLTVTSVLNSNKVVLIKADDVRVSNWYSPAWTNFIVASGNLGIKIGLGIIATNITDSSASAWLRAKDATGEVEFWDHGWDHTQWTVVNGSTTTTVSEFEGSGLAYMRQHLANAQSNILAAVGKNAIALGTGYNGFDTNTAAVINETPALRMFFTRDLALAGSIVTSRVALVDIISESGGTGKPDAALFKAAYPAGPTGPISLQHHPANFDSTGVTQYMAIVEYLLTNGYAFLTPSEYVALSDPPTASFSASPTNSGAPLTVNFTDTSTGVITNRYWNFGDGATTNVTATSLTHTYSLPGTNTVALIVSGANGSSTNVRANLIVVTSETMLTRTNVTVFATVTNWTCPANVTSIQVECWGAGGGGGSAWRDPATGSIQYGGGAAGGAYAKVNSYSVTPGNTYYINVGAGGANSSTNNGTTVAGGDSWFNSVNSPSATLIAKGGAGGQSAVGNTPATAYGLGGTGTATGSAGDVVYAGGSGAAGAASAAGGGGSSAGTGANGTAATSNIGAAAPVGGGDGGTGPTTSSGNGGSGSAPGGGGAGARASTIQSGGRGAAGQVVLSYTTTSVGVSAAAATPTGNGSGTGGWTTYAQRTRITLTETPSAGTGPFTYAWKKVGSGNVIGTNSSLVVSSPVNGDQYTCGVAATWDGVTNTSAAATVTVTSVVDSNKVAFIKADAFRALGPAWTNFLVASRDLGIKVNIGPICTNNIDPAYAIAQPASYQNTTNWMQTQQAMGDVEFFQYGWTHTTWLDTNGVTIYEYNGSGLAFQQDNFAKAQAALSNALGRSAITFGPSFNQVDTDTATVLNAAPEIKLFFASSVSTAQAIGLDPRVAVAPIYNETSYGEGVGLPNAAMFKAAFPSGPPGPAALQFHPSDPSFDAYRVDQYAQIVQHLLTNGYAILLPSEYVELFVPNTSPSVSLTAPTNNASFTAPASITITAAASDTDGTVTNVSFYNGATLLGSDASSPYAYTWTNVAPGSYSLTARATDNDGAVSTSAVVTVTVANPVYTLTVNSGTGGGSCTNGQQVAISAYAPADGKAFDKWTGDTQYVNNVTYTNALVTMPTTNVTVTATYVDVYYALTVNNGTGGGGSYTNGTQVAIAANAPAAGKAFDKWVGDTQYVANAGSLNTTVTMPTQAITLTATYADVYYSLTINYGTGGGLSYTNEQQVAILANAPAAGKVFDKWIGDTQFLTNASSASTSLTMPAQDVVLTATYVDVYYSLTVNGGTGGGSYTNGRQVAISADAPAAGKVFSQWLGDIQYVDNVTYTNALVTMSTNAVTLTATYSNLYYTLTATAGAGGTVSPTIAILSIGDSTNIVITASNYYRIAGVFTNGVPVTGMSFDNNSTTTNFIWSNVQTSGVLAATFAAQVTTNGPAQVPYSWLAQYGLTNYNTDAATDQDQDGLTTWQEYIAGTVPTNGTSCFKAAQNTRNVISWSSVSGRVYSVYWSTNLVKGFTNLNNNIPYPQSSFTNPTPDGRVNQYQIKVRLQ